MVALPDTNNGSKLKRGFKYLKKAIHIDPIFFNLSFYIEGRASKNELNCQPQKVTPNRNWSSKEAFIIVEEIPKNVETIISFQKHMH